MGTLREVSSQNAVSDAGPILHLSEIDALKSLRAFQSVFIPPEVAEETKKSELEGTNVQIVTLSPAAKNMAGMLIARYSIDLGEAEAISLATAISIQLFLTDDLAARNAAKELNLESHGTLGIILRAFREKIFSKQEAIAKIENAHTNSSIFLTRTLTNHIIGEIERFSKLKHPKRL